MTLTLKNVQLKFDNEDKSIVFSLSLSTLNLFNVEISSASGNNIVKKITPIFVIMTEDNRNTLRINIYQLNIEKINFIETYLIDLDRTNQAFISLYISFSNITIQQTYFEQGGILKSKVNKEGTYIIKNI
jgi:hypothetical protein